jgi:hypothetical protein
MLAPLPPLRGTLSLKGRGGKRECSAFDLSSLLAGERKSTNAALLIFPLPLRERVPKAGEGC